MNSSSTIPLSERIAFTAPLIRARSPGTYLRDHIRPRLLRAFNEDRLTISVHDISSFVKVTTSTLERDAFDLIGGRRNFRRDLELADIKTPDGGWLSFSAILRPKDNFLELLGYTFERVFEQESCPAWVRYDYNERGHDNEGRGLRSHIHASDDDMQLPAPILAPHELIDLLLGDLGPRHDRKQRTKGLNS